MTRVSGFWLGLFEFGVQDGFFVGGAHGALSFAAGGAALDVFEEGAGCPGVVVFGVLEAALAQVLRDGGVVQGFVCG
jgi:hypothetical protein